MMRWIVCWVAMVTACADSKPATCTDVDGTIHEAGETWDAGDGCNTCSCEDDGLASCTDLGCIDSDSA